MKYLQPRKFRRLVWVVVRISTVDGSFKKSNPCKNCTQTLRNFGVRKICYPEDDGENFIEKNLQCQDEMSEKYYQTTHVTYGNR